MMRTHTLWVLIAVAAIRIMGGAGCKKDAEGTDNKSYLTDQVTPLNDTVNQDTDTDPCLTKGATGANALLLKMDCEKVASMAVCGNGGKLETGEDCDDGNVKNGDGCSSACKDEKKKEVPPGTVAITTLKDDAQFSKCIPEKSCTVTITAEGVKGSNYDWSLTSAPKSFKAPSTSNTSSYSLKSESVAYCDVKDPKYDVNNCTIAVKVCPKGDSEASHCDSESFVLTAVEKLTITATAKTPSTLTCSKSGCVYKPKAEDFFGAVFEDWGNHNYTGGGHYACALPDCNPQYEGTQLLVAWKALDLKVTGTSVPDSTDEKYDVAKQAYTWTVSVGDNASAKYSESIVWSEGQGWKVAFPEEKEAIFVMGDNNSYMARYFANNTDYFIPWDQPYLMVRPGTEGKTYNLQVTVAGPHGSTSLPLSITVPAGTAKAIADKATGDKNASITKISTAKAAGLAVCNAMPVTFEMIKTAATVTAPPASVWGLPTERSVTIDVKNVMVDETKYEGILTVGDDTVDLTSLGVKDLGLSLAAGSKATYSDSWPFKLTPSKNVITIEWPLFGTVTPTVEDSANISFRVYKNEYTICDFDVTIKRHARYPSLKEEKIDILKSVQIAVGVLDVEDQSKFELVFKDANSIPLIKTDLIKAGTGKDPTVYKGIYTLVNVEDGALGDITQIDVNWQDPGSGGYMDVWLFGYKLTTKYRELVEGDLTPYFTYTGFFDEMWTLHTNATLKSGEAGGKTGSFNYPIAGKWKEKATLIINK